MRRQQAAEERGLGTGEESWTRLLQLSILSLEGVRRVATGVQSFESLWLRHLYQVQDRDGFLVGVDQEGGCDVCSRHQGCLLPESHSSLV